MTSLTESAVNKAIRDAKEKRQRAELADPDQPGLRLRIGATGQATWILGCRDAMGAPRRFRLGPAGKDGLGLRAAREAARSQREKVRSGADPIAEARAKRQRAADAREGINTLTTLLDLYEGRQGNQLKSWSEQRRRIEGVFAPFLKRPLGDLTAAELQLCADAYPAQQSAAAATRYIRPILKWAAASGRGYVPVTAALLVPPARVKRRERVLTGAELARLLPVLDNPAPYRRALRFMLLTLARREEVAAARWQDVDLAAQEWRIPDTKSGTPHRVPLSPQALALLDFIGPPHPDGLLFPGRGASQLQNWDRATKLIQEASKTKDWQRHDLRRTGATLLGELGIEPHVIEAALNHAALHSGLASIYNRARYFPHVRRALEMLADRLDGIANGGAEVVTLDRHRQASA